MKKKLFFPFLLLFIFNSAAQEKQNSKYRIEGVATTYADGDKIYISYFEDKNNIVDSASIESGRFVLEGMLSSPGPAGIYNNRTLEFTSEGASYIYIEPRKMDVSVDYRDFSSLQLTGSTTHTESKDLEYLKRKALATADSVRTVQKHYSLKINAKDKDSLEINNQLRILKEILETVSRDITSITFSYLRDHPTTYIATDILYHRLLRKGAIDQYQEIQSLYENMSEDVKKSPHGIRLRDQLAVFGNIILGKPAPQFAANDVHGNKIQLADFKGKYVLLDFWASWCAPCRQDFPALKEIYRKYHSKGFEIINISRDNSLEGWRMAIEKDGIGNWNHISIKENVTNADWLKNNFFEKQYVVTAIPVKILLDKNGNIVARWHGNTIENKQELEQILSEGL